MKKNPEVENSYSKIPDNERWIHFNYIGTIINRVASNHFKWYISLVSVFGIIISFYSVLLAYNKISTPSSLMISLGVGIPMVTVLVWIVHYCSNKYLKMEKGFIKMQQKLLDGKIAPSYNFRDFIEKTKKKNNKMKRFFVPFSSWVLTLLSIISAIIFPIISYFA